MILTFSQKRKGVTETFRKESSGRCDQMVVRPNAEAAKTPAPQCDLSLFGISAAFDELFAGFIAQCPWDATTYIQGVYQKEVSLDLRLISTATWERKRSQAIGH